MSTPSIGSLRARSALVATIAYAATFAVWPELTDRIPGSMALLMSVGYGHFLGGAMASRARMKRWLPSEASPALFAAWAACTAASIFAGFVWLVQLGHEGGGAAREILFAPLLAISLWHVAENDLALARAMRSGCSRVGALPRDGQHHLLSAGWGLLALALALASIGPDPLLGLPPSGDNRVPRLLAALCGVALTVGRSGPWARAAGIAIATLSAAMPAHLDRHLFGDLFFLCMMYHFASWVWLFADRARAHPKERREIAWRLITAHAPTLALAPLATLGVPSLEVVRLLLFAPVLYLFWSLVHILQTLVLRGVESDLRMHNPRP